MKKELIIGLGSGVMSALCTGMLFLSGIATADGDPTTDTVPRYIPYNGSLEYNGEALTMTGNDAPWLRFEVTDGLNGASVLTQDVQAEVYAGKFSVLLGHHDGTTSYVQSGDVVSAASGADELYLAITVLNQHDPASPNSDLGNDNVALSNPQRLLMTPFSVWATHATDFDVSQALEVGTTLSTGGNATIGGSLTVTDAVTLGGAVTAPSVSTTGNITSGGTLTGTSGNISGDLTVGGKVDAGGWAPSYASWNAYGLGDGLAAIYNANDGEQALMIVGNNSAGGQRVVKMWDDVTINDDFTVKDDASVGGNLTVTDNLTAGGLSTVGGLKLTYDNWASSEVGDGGAAIRNDSNSFQALMIVGNDSEVADTRRIEMYDDVYVRQKLRGDSNLFRTTTGDNREGNTVGSTSGNDYADLGLASNRMCFLTKVEVDTQQGDTRFRCQVGTITIDGASHYYLQAGRQNSTDVECSARCIVWD